MHPGYLMIASKVVDRVLEFIPAYPEIVFMSSADELMQLDARILEDINPSFAQAQMGLEKAQEIWRKSKAH